MYNFDCAVTQEWSNRDFNGRMNSNDCFERRCHHCGIWFRSVGPYFEGGFSMPRSESLRYCNQCLTEYDWRKAMVLAQPHKTPIKRPKIQGSKI
jgi:hypothetical protein